MYRSALRSTPRIAGSLRQTAVSASGRRFASTSPADKPRTWKSYALRLGIAGGLVYWYTTNTIFADQPEPRTFPAPAQFSDEDLPTVEAVVEQKRKEAEARTEKAAKSTEVAAPKSSEPQAQSKSTPPPTPDADTGVPLPGSEGSPEALAEEAGQQGAFNPETGEINWDCPCLGGMADGPCGEDFKAAFSCFVYSTEEPKGMDCIDKFQGMQDCFRKYPEIYGAELDDEEEAPADVDGAGAGEPQTSTRSKDSQEGAPTGSSDTSNTASTQVKPRAPIEESPEALKVEGTIPKKAYDTTVENHKPQESKDDDEKKKEEK